MLPITTLLGLILGLLVGAILHEIAHGYVADRLGDPTARISGRLTLNPIPHIDPIGSLLLPAILIITGANFFFAWAKPVPIDPFNFRNPRRDILLVSIAGIVTNLVIATFLAIIFHLVVSFAPATILTVNFLQIVRIMIFINAILAIFNLIPIPPLDGSKILMSLLPQNFSEDIAAVEPYGFFIIILLLFVPVGNASLLFLILNTPVSIILNLLGIPLL